MSFPIKQILTGQELLAMYAEPGGNKAILVSDLISLVGASDNGMFSPGNFWDGSKDGSNIPLTGIWTPAPQQPSVFPPPNLFLNESWVIAGSYDYVVVPGEEVFWAPASSPKVSFIGLSEFSVRQNSNPFQVDLPFFEIDNSAATLQGGGGNQLTLTSSIVRLQGGSIAVYIKGGNAAVTGWTYFGGNLGGTTSRAQFLVHPSGGELAIHANNGNYFLGNRAGGNLPNQDDTAPQLLALDTTDGRIVMRDPATIGLLPLSQADQSIPTGVTRSINGPNTADLTISGLNSFTVNSIKFASMSGTSLTTLGISNSQLISSASSLRLNNSLSSYVYGNGSGGNLPPSNTNIDTYLTLDGNGNIGRRTVVPGSGPNWANTNLTLTASRTHTGGGFALSYSSLLSFFASAVTSHILLDSTQVELINDGGAPDLATYKLGNGSANTRMPDDPGGNLFLKYDETTGQVYKENTVLAADGNGMFDINNNGTWLVDTWNFASTSVATVGTSFTFKTPTFTVTVAPSGLLVSDTGTLPSQIGISSATTAAKIDLGTGAAVSGFYIGTGDSSHDQFEIQRKDGVVPIVRIVRTAPSLSLVINSSGEIGLSTYSGTPVAPGTEVRLLGVDSAGTMIPVDSAGYENTPPVAPSVEWRQTKGDNINVTTVSQILALTAEAGSGTKFIDLVGDISITDATFVDVGLDVVLANPGGVISGGSVQLFDRTNSAILAVTTMNTKTSGGEAYITLRHMFQATGTEVLSIVIVNALGATVKSARLNVRN